MISDYSDVLTPGDSRAPTPATPANPPADRHLWEITPVRDLLWTGGIAFLLWFGYHLRGVFTPILIALLLAYL